MAKKLSLVFYDRINPTGVICLKNLVKLFAGVESAEIFLKLIVNLLFICCSLYVIIKMLT